MCPAVRSARRLGPLSHAVGGMGRVQGPTAGRRGSTALGGRRCAAGAQQSHGAHRLFKAQCPLPLCLCQCRPAAVRHARQQRPNRIPFPIVARAAVFQMPEPPPVPSPAAALCVHGVTLAGVQALPGASAPRDLDVLEIFVGVAAIVRAASARGFSAIAFDRDRLPGTTNAPGAASEDLTLQEGFMSAVRLTCRLRRGGLLWLAPVCSSFVFMNRSRTRRTRANPAGNREYAPVRTGNTLAEVAAFLWALATLRGATAVLENPTSSVIFYYGPVSSVLGTFQVTYTRCDRCCFSDAPMGTRWWKPFTFAGARWPRHLQRLCECPGRTHQPLCRTAAGKTSGTPALRASQAYPLALGEWVIEVGAAHGSCSQPCPASPRVCKRAAGKAGAATRGTQQRVPGDWRQPTASPRAPTEATLWRAPAEAAPRDGNAGAAKRPLRARRAPAEAAPWTRPAEATTTASTRRPLSSEKPGKHPPGSGAPLRDWKVS